MPKFRSAAVRSVSTWRPNHKRASGTVVRQAAVEALEDRVFLSVSHDSAGFTAVTPSAGARVVYVSSSSGSDSSNGLSSSSPVRTLAHAEKLLRSGTGDQLLLKRGDSWHESLGYWGISGQSSANPALIGSYGTGSRPTLFTGGQNGILISGKGQVHDLDIIGIHFDASGRGSSMPDGITSAGGVHNLLIEDCDIEKYRNDITLSSFFSTISNVTIRRSVIADSYSKATHSQGVYAEGVIGVTLQDNVFDHNGWGNGASQTAFNHDAYITATSANLVATGNIFANASSHGLQARPGGIVENNLFVNDAIGLSFGLVNGSGPVKAGGVTGIVANNVFVGTHSINGVPAGLGIDISNIKPGSGATVTGNIFANGGSAKNPAICLDIGSSSDNGWAQVGVNDLTVSNNIVTNWYSGLQISGQLKPGSRGPTALNHLTVAGNNFQTNSRKLQAAGTGKSLTGYNSSIGGDVVAKARTLSGQSWNTRYTAASVVAYLKGGSIPSVATPTPVVTPSVSIAKPSSSKALPSVTINDVKTTEGNYGKKYMTFVMSLSQKPTSKVTVSWQTKARSASAATDYIGQHGTMTFNPGQTSKTVTIAIRSDRAREATETFAFQLLGAKGATIARSSGTGTILNDD